MSPHDPTRDWDLAASDPRTVGPYQVTRRLGQGGMGVVYLGIDTGHRQVALKVVQSAMADQPHFRARFAREVESARSVSANFTARVVDADTQATPQWIATEYVPGPTLAEHIENHGPMPEQQVRLLGLGLAEAIEAIHTAGLIHRDLKPSNVILSPGGPKVIDFGISQATDATSLTQTGVYLGSLAWMSPEQVTGGQVTTATDMFSLGLLLAYAATGQHPYGEGRPEAVAFRTVNQAPDLSSLSRSMREICSQLLSPVGTARPTPQATVGALTGATTAIEDVTRVMQASWDATTFVGTETPAITPGTNDATSRKPSRRTASVRAGVAVAALAGAVGVAVAAGVIPLPFLSQAAPTVSSDSVGPTGADHESVEGSTGAIPAGTDLVPADAITPPTSDGDPTAGEMIAACMEAHGMDFPSTRTVLDHDNTDWWESGSPISTVTVQECLWPAPNWAAPDGYNVITTQTQVGDPGAPNAANTGVIDVISARCPVVEAQYDFVKFGSQQPQPIIELAGGDVRHGDGSPHDGPVPVYLDADQRLVFAGNYQQQTVSCATSTAGTTSEPSQPIADLAFPGPVRVGDSGAAVLTWQEILIYAGVISDFPENRDGVYGPAMENAVREYQQQWGLTVDGVAGSQTWAHIVEQLAHQDLR